MSFTYIDNGVVAGTLHFMYMSTTIVNGFRLILLLKKPYLDHCLHHVLPYFYNVKSIKTIANGSNNIDRVHEGFFARVQIGNSWLVVMSQLQQGIEPTAIHLDDNLLLH